MTVVEENDNIILSTESGIIYHLIPHPKDEKVRWLTTIKANIQDILEKEQIKSEMIKKGTSGIVVSRHSVSYLPPKPEEVNQVGDSENTPSNTTKLPSKTRYRVSSGEVQDDLVKRKRKTLDKSNSTNEKKLSESEPPQKVLGLGESVDDGFTLMSINNFNSNRKKKSEHRKKDH